MTFSEVLLQKRKSLGLSQEALADRLGVSRQAVSKWETGEASPDLNKLVALSAALDLSLDTLCGLQEEAPAADLIPSPAKHRTPMLIALAAALLIAVFAGGFFLGRSSIPAPPTVEATTSLPETINVTGLNFSPETDGVTYQFTPGVISPDFTYQITFAATGRAVLDAWNNYSVTVTVSNGQSTRAVSVAYDLSYQPSANGENGLWLGGSTSWHPVD